MTTTTAKKAAPKQATRKPAPAKQTTKATTAKPKASPAPSQPTKAKQSEPKTLQEALSTGAAVLVKIRANGTVRSLPYLVPGTEARATAKTVDERRAAGQTVEKIAEDMDVSVATVRRYVSGLALAHEVEDGKHNKAWTKGERNVVVHCVAKAGK